MNTMAMLVRRELWEHRSLWIAPLAVVGFMLVITLWSTFVAGRYEMATHFGDATVITDLEDMDEEHRSGLKAVAELPQERKQTMYVFTALSMSGAPLVIMCIVVFFYLLDCLYAERRDRSILFWKSLPVSDAQVVLSKIAVALVLVPIAVLVLGAMLQLLTSVAATIRFNGTLIDEVMPDWSTWAFLRSNGLVAAIAVGGILWCAPVTAYLLLVSVWARRNVFLWAVVPPVALMIGEKVVFHTSHIALFVARRLFGFIKEMDLDSQAFEHHSVGAHADDVNIPSIDTVFDVLSLQGMYTHYEMWVGLLCAALMVAAAIRIRRYRDDS